MYMHMIVNSTFTPRRTGTPRFVFGVYFFAPARASRREVCDRDGEGRGRGDQGAGTEGSRPSIPL